MNLNLLTLKSKICGFEHVSGKIRKDILRTSGPKRASYRYCKLFVGVTAREHLIAYAILRKIPYEKVEQKCAKGHEPVSEHVLNIIHSHVYPSERKDWTLKRVNDLLKRPEVDCVTPQS